MNRPSLSVRDCAGPAENRDLRAGDWSAVGPHDPTLESDSRAGGDEQSDQPYEKCGHVRRNLLRVRTRANYYQWTYYRWPVASGRCRCSATGTGH